MFVIEPHSDLCVFAYVGLLDLVFGEGVQGTQGNVAPCVVVGDRIRQRTPAYIHVTRPGCRYLSAHSPSRSVCFLCENGGLRRDRTSSMQTHSGAA